jgi:hypothetical protein
MPLFGTLKTMSLPDLLQWLGAGRKTGTLQVESNRVRKCILFKDGQIYGCSSDDPPERLGHFLLSRGKITEDQLRIALAAQEGSGKFLGRLFVEMGAIQMDELTGLLDSKAEETIYSLFDWENAVFRFHEELAEQPNVFPVSLRVEDVLLRGMKRLDEMLRIRKVFKDPGIVLVQTDKAPPEELLDSKMARAIYEAVNGERTVAGILLHVHGSQYLVTKLLYELHRKGFIEIAGVKPIKRPEAEIVQAADPPAPGAQPIGQVAAHEPVASVPSETGPPAEPAAQSPSPVEPTAAALVDLDLATPGESAAGASASAVLETDEILDIPEVFFEASDVEAVEDSEPYQQESQLEAARRQMSSGEYDAALEILEALYAKNPDDDSLRKLTAEAEAAFIDKAYRHYVPGDRVPAVLKPVEDLEAQNLSPTEFFLLSRIDGTWDVKSIIQIAPLREVEALLTLKRLREKGVIELRDPADRSGR